jgi:DNA repair exonuclease SbcCD ATPase subunit
MAMPKKNETPVKPSKTQYDFINKRVSELEKYHKELTKTIEILGRKLTEKIDDKTQTNNKIKELQESYKNMKKTDVQIVSLNEFKKVKNSIKNLKELMKETQAAIEISNEGLMAATKSLKICKKDLSRCKKDLDQFGVIHEFNRSRNNT